VKRRKRGTRLDLYGEELAVCPDRATLENQIVTFVEQQVRPRLAIFAA
jgi:hypothetical protein